LIHCKYIGFSNNTHPHIRSIKAIAYCISKIYLIVGHYTIHGYHVFATRTTSERHCSKSRSSCERFTDHYSSIILCGSTGHRFNLSSNITISIQCLIDKHKRVTDRIGGNNTSTSQIQATGNITNTVHTIRGTDLNLCPWDR